MDSLLVEAKKRADQSLGEVRQDYLKNMVPDLSEDQLQWIANVWTNDPANLTAMMKKYGTLQTEAFLRRYVTGE